MNSKTLLIGLLPIVVTALCGCGGHTDYSASIDPGSSDFDSVESFSGTDEQSGFQSSATAKPSATTGEADDQQIPSQSSKPDSNRKIIYTANMSLSTESMDDVPAAIAELCREFDGFVATAQTTGESYAQRRGNWTLRIPSNHYREVVDRAGNLGELSSFQERTEEVTAEYFDVEARIRNKQREEERLNDLLSERSGKLEDVLNVEREISRVREEVERMQGRLRVLNNLTSLSTIHIEVYEVLPFTPPSEPTLATAVARQWSSTITGIQGAARSLVLTAVAIVPWLFVFTLPVACVIWIWRTISRNWKPASTKLPAS